MSCHRGGAALMAALALGAILGACGDDDRPTSAPDPAPTVPAGSRGTPATGGRPSQILSTSLDGLTDIAMPEAGTAVIVVNGVEWTFPVLDECGVGVDPGDGAATFTVHGRGRTADGLETELEVRRRVADARAAVGGTHETDWVQLSVQMETEPGPVLWSRTSMDVTRLDPEGPVSGDAEELPVIKVVEANGTFRATARARVDHMAYTEDYDAAGEGPFELAVHCG